MTRKDVNAEISYGQAWDLEVVFQDAETGLPVDVTGYWAELRISRNGGGTRHGITAFSWNNTSGGLSVGTTNGRFARTLTPVEATALGAVFGTPIPRRKGRWSLWIMPPGGTIGVDDFPVAYGRVKCLPVGETPSPVRATVYENDFRASVTAVGALGAPGPAGPAGPTGPPGSGGAELRDVADVALPAQPVASSPFVRWRDKGNGRNEPLPRYEVTLEEQDGFAYSAGHALGDTTSGSAVITNVTNVANLTVGAYVWVFGVGATHALTAMAAPTCTVLTTTGGNTGQYVVAALSQDPTDPDWDWGVGVASSPTTVANLPDYIANGQYNLAVAPYSMFYQSSVRIEVTPQAGAYMYAVWYRNGTSGSYTLIGAAREISGEATQFNDRGNRALSATMAGGLGNTPPAAAFNRRLRARILSIVGTTVTLDTVCQVTRTQTRIDTCNKIPIRAAMAAANAAGHRRLAHYGFGRIPIQGNLAWETTKRFYGGEAYAAATTPRTIFAMGPGAGVSIQESCRYAKIGGFQIASINNRIPANLSSSPSPFEGSSPDLRFHGTGLHVETECKVQDIVVSGVGGSGVIVRGNGSAGTNANRAYCGEIRTYDNLGHGFVLSGGEANAVKCVDIDSQTNLGDQVLDASFLGGQWTFVHCVPGVGGRPFVFRDNTCFGVATHVYVEDGPTGRGVYVGLFATFIPGTNGAGYDPGSSGIIIDSGKFYGIDSRSHSTTFRQVMLGDPNNTDPRNVVKAFGPSVSSYQRISHGWRMSDDDTRMRWAFDGAIGGALVGDGMWQWGGPDNPRASGKVHFPYTFFVGKQTSDFRALRFEAGTPAQQGILAVGDYCFDLNQPLLRSPTYQFGVGALPWAPSTLYPTGAVVTPPVPDGHVYHASDVRGRTDNMGLSGAVAPVFGAGNTLEVVGSSQITWTRITNGASAPEYQTLGFVMPYASGSISASVGPTNVYRTVPPAGTYEIGGVVLVTAGAGGSTVTVTVTWNGGTTRNLVTTASTASTGEIQLPPVFIRTDGVNHVTITVTIAGGAPTLHVHVPCQRKS